MQIERELVAHNRKKIAVIYNYLGSITLGGYLEGLADQLARDFFISAADQMQFENFDFFICSSNSAMPAELSAEFPVPISGNFIYTGRGWDVGAYVFSAQKVKEYDLAVFMNSQSRFSSSEALVSISKAWQELPHGILGFSSSFEVTPHIRTSAFAIPPQLLLRYPNRVSSRYDACVFEHSPESLTNWVLSQNLPARVTYKSGVFDLANSRKSIGVFRSSEQQLLLVSDRHTRLFADASNHEKAILESRANNIPHVDFRHRSRIVAWMLRLPIDRAPGLLRALRAFRLDWRGKNKS